MTEEQKNILDGIKNFGQDAAEQEDSDYLVQHFVQTEAYKEAADGTKTLIIGRKGSGKSAIFLFLKQNRSSLGSSDAMFVVPDDVSASSIRNFLGKGVTEQSAKTLIWKYLFLVLISRFLIKIAETKFGDEKKWTEDIRKIKRFLVDNDQIDNLDLAERIRKFISKIQPDSVTIKLPTIAEVGVGKSKNADAESDLIAGIGKIEKLISAAISTPEFLGQRLHIYVDQVDEFWLNDEASNQMIIGLIMAASHVNANFRKIVRCIIFLRTDIYQSIEFHDKDKLHGSELEIKWDESSLRELISGRIAQTIKSDLDTKNATELVFHGQINDIPALDYIVSRTLFRPRELILFCNKSLEIAKKNKHNSIEPDDILKAEDIYSKNKLSDLVTEYKNSYPFLNDFLVLFEKRFGHSSPDFDRAYLTNKYATIQKELSGKYSAIDQLSVDILLAILYNINFIGVVRGDTVAYKYLDSRTVGSLDSRFKIHPTFWKALGVQPGETTSNSKMSSPNQLESSMDAQEESEKRSPKVDENTAPKILAGVDEVKVTQQLSALDRYANDISAIILRLGHVDLETGNVLQVRTVASLEQAKSLLLLLSKRAKEIESERPKPLIRRYYRDEIGQAGETIKICRLIEMSIKQTEKLLSTVRQSGSYWDDEINNNNQELSRVLSQFYTTVINDYGFDILVLDKPDE